MQYILDSTHTNPLFYSLVSKNSLYILDVSACTGIWAQDVAERYPSGKVAFFWLNCGRASLIPCHSPSARRRPLPATRCLGTTKLPTRRYAVLQPSWKGWCLHRNQVDDLLKPWDYRQLLDLVHLRTIVGAFTTEQWRLFYETVYKSASYLFLDIHF